MADVSVDTETGVVRMNKMVAVQDCGTIIALQTAESQVYGGLIMGIAYSLTEERIMDQSHGPLHQCGSAELQAPPHRRRGRTGGRDVPAR